MEQEYYKRTIELEARMRRQEAMMLALLRRLGIDPETLTLPEPEGLGAVHEALMSGNKLQAIKLYRQLYGADLKAAKDAVDAMEINIRRR